MPYSGDGGAAVQEEPARLPARRSHVSVPFGAARAAVGGRLPTAAVFAGFCRVAGAGAV